MAQSKFAKRLATMQKKYEAAQAPAGFGECPLEVGRYRAKISAELKDIAGKMAIEWSFTVVEGDFEGETATQLDGLENENSFGYLKKRLKQFGYDPDDVQLAESLESILDQINESELVGVIQVKQNGDYTNVYLNKVELEESEDAEEDGAEESEEESEDEAEEEASDDEDENDSEEEEEAEEEEAEEEATIEKGSTVLYQKPKSKKAEEFEVLSVDEKKGTAKLKGIPTSVPLAELTLVEAEEEAEEEEEEEEAEEVEEEADAEEEDDDTVELEVGSKVACDIKGRPVKGTVVSIDADSETAKVKTADGKILKVSFEQISAL
jgi:hypothetical protein